jgi:plastocyanin
MSRTTSRLTVVALTIVASALLSVGPATAGGGCMHGTSPTDGTGSTVEMVDACFTPTVLHVERGAEVDFVNRDEGVAHNVVGVGGTWGSVDNVSFGESASYRFDSNGVYLYACFLHEGMIGAVVVGDGSGSADLASVHPAVQNVIDTDSDGTAPAAEIATSEGVNALVITVIVVGLLLSGLTIGLVVRGRRRSISA